MAEAIALDIASNIVTKLGVVAFREICSMYGLNDDLKKLQETLSTINVVLVDADRRQEESDLIQLWIRRLNDVVYDADDLLDAFHTKHLQRENGRTKMQEVCEFFSSSNQLAFRYKLGHRIKKIRERLDEIAIDMLKFNFVAMERVIDRARGDGRDRETDSYVLESEVIGREKEKEEIIDMLMRSSTEENVSIICIVGIGGLGKTALTQLVYRDKRVVEHFESMIWVCVSEDFEKKSLVRRILQSITNKEVGELGIDQLQRQLRENIDGKRYLLVLDDIWNEDHEKWAGVKKFLMGGAQGSKILVTTRSRIVSSVMGVEKPYILEGLTEKQSWNLFVNIAFFGRKEVHPNIKAVGEQIVARCKGVPLAIRSLGSVMKSKANESEWLTIQNSEVWSLCESKNSIMPILKLSYDHLPIRLRKCFAFCSLFPKDHEFGKELIVQLWMAQGYIQSSDGSQFLEEIGGQYFEDLLSRSFFQDVQRVDYSNEILSCKMHDLIHDLAIRVVGTHCCFIAQNDAAVNISERLHHVSFENPSQDVLRQLLQARGLRTYFSVSSFYSTHSEEYRANIFLLSKFKRMRALDLRCYDFKMLPNWVCKMQHLRYLDLSGNDRMKVIPNTITNLVNLQMLNLSDCYELKELPEGIGKLISLRHLVFDECDKICYMPRGLEKLTSLQTLSKFIVGGNKRRSIGLGALKDLNNLRGRLRIENLEKVRDARLESKATNLMGKRYVKELSLNWKIDDGGFEEVGVKDKDDDAEILLEGLQPHPNLRGLEIEGYSGARLPSWMMGNMGISLPNVVDIDLSDCPNIKQLPPFFQLPCLKNLYLRNLPKVEYGCDGDGFSSPLVKIFIMNCPNMRQLPPFYQLPCLTSLEIYTCPRLEYYGDGDGSSSSPSFPCLTQLSIYSCPMLTSIYSCPMLTSMPLAPLLERLELSSVSEKLLCQLLTTTTTIPSSSSSSSSPLSRLSSLSIRYIEDLEALPEEDVLRNLTSLNTLSISSCPRLLRLAEIQHLTALEDLTIYDCEEVDLSADGMNWQALSSLLRLVIEKLPKLVSLPEGLQHVTTLQRIKITDCPGLVALPEWMSKLTSLKTLNISSCPRLLRLAEIQHLTALEDLTIDDCEEVDLSADGMNWQALSSLRELAIKHLPKLVSLPEGFQHVTTLQTIDITFCPGLVALPEWMSNLTSLKHLHISQCPLLSERCRKDTGEDWPNIAHIPNIQIDWELVQGS